MSINYNVTGDRRKALVNAISDHLGIPSVYNGAPTFSYSVGVYVIDRYGAVSYPEHASRELALRLTAALRERGFHPQTGEAPDKLVVEMPLEGFTDQAIRNLGNIVASKNRLIKRALGADSLRIDIVDDKLSFPWFTLTGAAGEADAYVRFVAALCDMAKKQKRVTAQERSVVNEKFTMRLFLVRLGFVGNEYTMVRYIMLRNLTGNSAWKNGRPPERTPAPVLVPPVNIGKGAESIDMSEYTKEN